VRAVLLLKACVQWFSSITPIVKTLQARTGRSLISRSARVSKKGFDFSGRRQ
jgi:hypothetical protein